MGTDLKVASEAVDARRMPAPLVTCVIPAYQLAHFLPRAIQSALDQDWPAEALEVIVVDDGSTDETPDVLERYGDRITAIRQPNRGLLRAVERGIGAARGAYIGLLDADDEWPRDRVARHVAALEQDPALTLVHGDMEVVDANGALISPSFFAGQPGGAPPSGRILGALLAGNLVSGGASTFRAAIVPAILPMPEAAPYPDWWIALAAAAVGEVAVVPGVANRYRYHGANMGLGANVAKQDEILRREIPWRRWMFREMARDDSVRPADVRAAVRSWEYGLARAAGDDGAVRGLFDVPAVDREAGASLAAQAMRARRDGRPAEAARLLLGALGADPWDAATGIELQLALAAADDATAAEPAPPFASLPVRTDVTVATAAELLAEPELLAAYARTVTAEDDATLVVLTTDAAEQDRIEARAIELGLASPSSPDVLLQPAPTTQAAARFLAARATATLTAGATVAAAATPLASVRA